MIIKPRSILYCSTLLIAFAAILSSPVYAANNAMLDLLKILHDKGSLTDEEFDLLVNAAKTDGEQVDHTATQEKTIPKVQAKSTDSGNWTDHVNIQGDVRLRFEHSGEEGTPTDRERGRLRYRLGIVAQPSAGWEAGAGLASGGSDLRSANQSFDSTFSTKGVNLNYAYAQYQFNDSIKGIGGKFSFKNYLYTATDLMWDSDINPEGFSVNLYHPGNLGISFANSGIWVLEENSSSDDDPFLYYLQLGQQFGSGKLFGTIAGTYYGFEDINSLGDIVTEGTNTDFRFGSIISLSGELGVNNFLDSGIKASIIADTVWNNDTATLQDTGFSIGLKASKGNWSFKYIYADLEENAWPDILPDSDRFDGITGIAGHEIIIDYALMKNVTLGIDYYNVDQDQINQDLLQMDVVVKY